MFNTNHKRGDIAVDFNKLIARIKAILLTPKTQWPVIAAEPATAAGLYTNYIMLLAAIPAVFSFLKLSLIGVSIPFAGTVRIGIAAGIANLIATYALSLLMVYVMALIINALAPTFGAQKDQTQALKTVAYAYTASWIAGFGQIVPGLWMLIAIAGGIYSIYLLYLGLPHTMKCPAEKAAGYTAVAIIVAILLSLVVGMIVAAVSGTGAYMRGGAFTVGDSRDVNIDKDSPLGKLAQYGKEMEKAGKQMEAAQKSGDGAAQADALKAVMGAALGGAGVEALPPDQLKPFVPESLAGMPRKDVSVERGGALGMQISTAHATYANDAGRSVQLEITDTGTAKGLLAFAGWAGMEGEKQSDGGYEKTYRADGRLVHEEWSGSSGQYTVVLGDRFTVELQGDADNIDQLKSALGELNLAGLEALKNEGVKAAN
ncbi:MAG TPA: Yip1 family protein [Steroidobacteraceae bacterium]